MALPPLRLQVLIATHRPEGIARVAAMNLPRLEDVDYLVSWQDSGDTPIPVELEGRRDVRVIRFARPGVSANRNNLLEQASGDFVLIADDDLVYTEESLTNVLACIYANPHIGYFSFRYKGPDNKVYPQEACSLDKPPRGFYQTAFEVALYNPNRCNPGRLRFNEYFGPGAPVLTAGEDEMLLLTARKMGLKCMYFPIDVATHPGLTTGSRKATPGVAKSNGAIIALEHPVTWPLRVTVNSWRMARKGRMGFLPALWNMAHGAVYALYRRRWMLPSSK